MKTWLCSKGAILALVLSAPLLAACAGGIQQPERLNLVDPDDGFARVWRDYPDMDPRYARTGTRHTIADVQGVALGQDDTAVQAAIGKPAIIYAGKRIAEYNLSLPLTRRDRLICQYHVYFDDAGKVTATVWRRPQCADLVTGKAG